MCVAVTCHKAKPSSSRSGLRTTSLATKPFTFLPAHDIVVCCGQAFATHAHGQQPRAGGNRQKHVRHAGDRSNAGTAAVGDQTNSRAGGASQGRHEASSMFARRSPGTDNARTLQASPRLAEHQRARAAVQAGAAAPGGVDQRDSPPAFLQRPPRRRRVGPASRGRGRAEGGADRGAAGTAVPNTRQR